MVTGIVLIAVEVRIHAILFDLQLRIILHCIALGFGGPEQRTHRIGDDDILRHHNGGFVVEGNIVGQGHTGGTIGSRAADLAACHRQFSDDRRALVKGNRYGVLAVRQG